MPRLLLIALLFLATTVRVGNGEMPTKTVLDSKGIKHVGRYTGTWAGYNILYDDKWKEIYRFERY